MNLELVTGGNGAKAHAPSTSAAESAAGKGASAPARAMIACSDPATGEALGEVALDTPDEVRAIVARARTAQAAWAKTSFAERRRVLGKIRDHLLAHLDELIDLIARDAGKTRENALLGEIWPVCEKLRHTLATGERDLRTERVSSGLLMHKIAEIEYHPLGVIGVICPWNFPLQNVLGPVIPALMAGNACVVKVSEWVAFSSVRIQKIFDDVFTETGHSTDLVRLVNGYAETGQALCASGVDKTQTVGQSIFQGIAGMNVALEGLQGEATPATITSTAKAMPWSVLPASGGLHFRCNGKAAPAEPATCSNGILLATLDATGKAKKYVVANDAQIPG